MKTIVYKLPKKETSCFGGFKIEQETTILPPSVILDYHQYDGWKKFKGIDNFVGWIVCFVARNSPMM